MIGGGPEDEAALKEGGQVPDLRTVIDFVLDSSPECAPEVPPFRAESLPTGRQEGAQYDETTLPGSPSTCSGP